MKDKSLMTQFLILTVGILIFGLVFVVFISNFSSCLIESFEDVCDNYGGVLVFYECYRSPLTEDCEMQGYYCKLDNGTEVNMANEIEVIN